MNEAQIIASLLVLAGVYLYGMKHILAPLLSLIGCCIFVGVCINLDAWPMALLNVAFIVMHLRNAVKWFNEIEVEL